MCAIVFIENIKLIMLNIKKKEHIMSYVIGKWSMYSQNKFEGVGKMKLIEIANAGTLESSDIQIIIEPNENGGIVIELESVVKAQFGEQVEEVIANTLKELGVTDAKIFANDKGAIDPVIKSRVQTAVYRSAKTNDYKWM